MNDVQQHRHAVADGGQSWKRVCVSVALYLIGVGSLGTLVLGLLTLDLVLAVVGALGMKAVMFVEPMLWEADQ